MTNANLLTYNGAHTADRSMLATLPEPEKLGRFHQPTPHIRLVETLDRVLADRQLEILDEQFALYRDNSVLFGVMKLRSHDDRLPLAVGDDGTFALGLRTSTNRAMAIQLAVGLNILVCDNLVFHGDMIALRRKNTSGIDLPAELADGVDRYRMQQADLSGSIARAQADTLSDEAAKALIYDQFARGVMPGSHFPKVHANYFEATEETPDCLPRSRWGVHNALTREVRELKPRARFLATLKLGEMLRPENN